MTGAPPAGEAPPVHRGLVVLDVVLVAVFVVVAAFAGRTALDEAAGQPTGTRVLLVGDSIAGELSGPLEAAFAEPGDVASFSLLPALSTATIRTDVQAILDQQDPDLVLVMVGTWEAVGVDSASPGWEQRYVDDVLAPFVAQVQEAGADLLWLGYPRVIDDAEAEQHQRLNAVYESLAERLDDPSIGYLDLGPAVEAGDGTFTTTLEVDGRTVRVRADDGKHLCPDGAQRVTEAVVEVLAAEHDLEADPGWEQGGWRTDVSGFAEPGLCPGSFSAEALASTTTAAPGVTFAPG